MFDKDTLIITYDAERGEPREVDEGAIENVYRLQVMNTDERPHRYVVEVNGPPGATISSHSTFDVPSATTKAIPVRVRVPANAATPGSNPVWFVIRATENAELRVMEKGVFLIPK